MLSDQQQDDFLAFVANLTRLLKQAGMTRQQAKIAVVSAASALLGAVLHADPNSEEAQDFVVNSVKFFIDKFHREDKS